MSDDTSESKRDYAETLFLPQTDFPMRAGLPQKEPEILARWKKERLYDQLRAVMPTPVVALNRAIAIGEVHGPGPALALVDELDLGSYYAFHATRADLLRRLGRDGDAAAAYARAAALAPTDAERDFLSLGGRASREPRP